MYCNSCHCAQFGLDKQFAEVLFQHARGSITFAGSATSLDSRLTSDFSGGSANGSSSASHPRYTVLLVGILLFGSLAANRFSQDAHYTRRESRLTSKASIGSRGLLWLFVSRTAVFSNCHDSDWQHAIVITVLKTTYLLQTHAYCCLCRVALSHAFAEIFEFADSSAPAVPQESLLVSSTLSLSLLGA